MQDRRRAHASGSNVGLIILLAVDEMFRELSWQTARITGSEEEQNELPLIGVAADETRPERPLPGDALLQLCHRRHALLSFSLLSLLPPSLSL